MEELHWIVLGQIAAALHTQFISWFSHIQIWRHSYSIHMNSEKMRIDSYISVNQIFVLSILNQITQNCDIFVP